jgi:hypothetical protein
VDSAQFHSRVRLPEITLGRSFGPPEGRGPPARIVRQVQCIPGVQEKLSGKLTGLFHRRPTLASIGSIDVRLVTIDLVLPAVDRKLWSDGALEFSQQSPDYRTCRSECGIHKAL